jgi:DNA-binding CsgD family transcriptional regulator
LWVSRKTFEAQLGAVYQKLGISDRTALFSLLQTQATGDDPDHG